MVLLATVGTAAQAAEPSDAGDPAATAQASPASWDAAARELMRTGKLDEADSLLDVRLSAEPKDVQARFLKGMIALAKGDTRPAIRSFRNILIDHPEATRVRLELARAFYLENDYGNALRQFQFALADNPPREVVANIERYLASIREAKTLSYNLGISVAPDSNLNTGSSVHEISLFGLPFDLSDDARQRSGVGLALEGGGEWAPRLGPNKRLRMGFDVERREYAGSAFDDMTVVGWAGPRVVSGRWDLSLLAAAFQRSYGGKAYSDAVGGRAEATYHFSPRLEMTVAPAIQRLGYRRARERDGPLISLNAAGLYALSPSSVVMLKLGVGRQEARIAPYSNWSGYVAAGYAKDMRHGFSAYVEPALSIARYDEALLGFEAKRADTTRSLLVSVLNRRLMFGRFTPRIAYTYTGQSSSASLYAFTRNRVEIGLTTVF